MKTSTLAMVCSIELLERLAYFVFLTHFVSFLEQSGQMSTAEAVRTYGSLMLAVYAGPLVGGWAADRWLTVQRAARVGIFLLMTAYGLLAVMPSQILAAMCLLGAGSGLCKPTLYAVLAQGCGQSGLRREATFIAFFVTINLGGFLGGLVGPMLGLLLPIERMYQGAFLLCALCTALAALLSLVALKLPAAQPSLMPAPSPQPGPLPQKVAVWPVAVLCVTWMLGHCAVAQLNMTIMSWRNHADLTLGGLVPPGLGSMLLTGGEPLFQLVLVPVVLLGFLALRKRGLEPSATAKIGIGLILQLLPWAILLRGVVSMPEGLPLGGWLLGARLAGALPSLFLLPLMLSVLAQLVPARRHGALFGLWILLTAAMSSLGGHLAAWTRELPSPASFVAPAVFSLLAAGLWIAQSKRIEQALVQGTGAAPGFP